MLRDTPLEPQLRVSDQAEMERLKIPQETRNYVIRGETIYGLKSDGSLFKQVGLIREVIPSDASELMLSWSERGSLLAQRVLETEDQSLYSWFSAEHNSAQLTWSASAHRDVLGQTLYPAAGKPWSQAAR